MKTHLPGCCCLKIVIPGVEHECRCRCIQLGDYSADRLVRSSTPGGVLITGKPIEITEKEDFAVEITVPPLYRPDVEILVETLEEKDAAGEVSTTYAACLSDKNVKVGKVVVVLKEHLASVGGDKDTAVQKLCDLVGVAVVQAWADLAGSDDPNKQAAARAMEIK